MSTPLDQFHDEGLGALKLIPAMDPRDVRVVQRSDGLGFALEAGNPVGIPGERSGQHLDRDISIQLRIRRAVDLPLPPMT